VSALALLQYVKSFIITASLPYDVSTIGSIGIFLSSKHTCSYLHTVLACISHFVSSFLFPATVSEASDHSQFHRSIAHHLRSYPLLRHSKLSDACFRPRGLGVPMCSLCRGGLGDTEQMAQCIFGALVLVVQAKAFSVTQLHWIEVVTS
jgi:hypothetical protein